MTLSEIWAYTGVATLYAMCYAAFALAVGHAGSFQTRELGGAEG